MFKNSAKFIAMLLGVTVAFASTSQADFKRICRGGNLPRYLKEIKTDVKAKLEAASIQYNSVQVSITKVKRATDTYSTDFSSNLGISNGPIPSVSFTGAFPAITPCDITGVLRIAVRYPNGSSITKNNVTVPGTMLFRANIGNDAD